MIDLLCNISFRSCLSNKIDSTRFKMLIMNPIDLRYCDPLKRLLLIMPLRKMFQ